MKLFFNCTTRYGYDHDCKESDCHLCKTCLSCHYSNNNVMWAPEKAEKCDKCQHRCPSCGGTCSKCNLPCDNRQDICYNSSRPVFNPLLR